MALQVLLACGASGLVALLALGPALHLALGLALRDPELGGRVARGELGARALVLLGGRLGAGGPSVGPSGAGANSCEDKGAIAGREDLRARAHGDTGAPKEADARSSPLPSSGEDLRDRDHGEISRSE